MIWLDIDHYSYPRVHDGDETAFAWNYHFTDVHDVVKEIRDCGLFEHLERIEITRFTHVR